MEPRRIDMPLQGRAAELNSVDMKERTARLAWTTGAAVMRRDNSTGEKYIERLMVDKKALRLDRLNAGAPLLDSHRSYGLANVIGVVEPGSVRLKDGVGMATVKFSSREAVEPIFRDVAEGIIRNVSVGYIIHRAEQSIDKATKMATRTAVDWEPMELSLVPIPADASAQVRADLTELWPCEIVGDEDVRAEVAEENKHFVQLVPPEDWKRMLDEAIAEARAEIDADQMRLDAIIRNAKFWADARM